MPPTGIVKVTSSYKVDNSPGEVCAEIVEWGNDGRKVTHAYREQDGKLAGKPAGGNPFRHAQDVKVGDYVVYKVTEKNQVFAAASGQVTRTSTLTVSDRDEKAVAFDADYDFWTTDLTKPFDMCMAVAMIRTPAYSIHRISPQLGPSAVWIPEDRRGQGNHQDRQQDLRLYLDRG